MYGNKRTGGHGLADMTCFSFHPVKHITTGEGGAILTDDSILAKKLKSLRSHGIVKDPALMKENHGEWYYEMHNLGINGRITDFQCALGISQLARMENNLARRKEIADRYLHSFKDIDGLTCQKEFSERSNAYHLFVIHLDPEKYDRKKVFDDFKRNSIGIQVHYIPIHLQPFYQSNFGFSKGDFPEAERYYNGCISLPMFSSLGDDDLTRVIEVAIKTIKEGRKSLAD